jgi:hypothetical protein
MPSVRIGFACRIATLGCLVLFWFGLSGLLIVAWGDPEAFLRTRLARSSHADTFEHLNGVSVPFWLVHSCLNLMAMAAARYRRSDVMTVMMVGPIIALAIGVLGQTWSDPDWFVVVAVCTIGWLVGAVVGALYWGLTPRGTSA